MIGGGFLNIFAKSPIKPLQQHMQLILSCVQELIPFFESVLKQDWEQVEKCHSDILRLESEADDLKKELRLHLPNSLLMPVARTDLLGLLTSQDKIATKAKHLTGIIVIRRIIFPAVMADQLLSFIKLNIDTVSLAKKVIAELDELIETGFKGKEVKIAEELITQLDQVERDTDTVQVNLRRDIFKIEKNLDPIDAVFLYKIIDWAGELADCSQQVGHRLESLLA